MPREYSIQPFRADVDLHIDYRKELNDQQYAAVTAPPGPALVLAGAGAGKTRTLTYRVAYLLEQGIPPDRILLLTFTNKAAREMMRRVADLLSGDLRDLWGGTFHAIGNRLLRRHADRLGYQTDFTILDSEDAKHLLSACLGASKIDIKATRFPKPEVLAGMFSLAINTDQPMGGILHQYYRQFEALEPQIRSLHEAYQQRKRESNVMDFDDLLVLWLRLLREHEDIRERYQRQFQFVLVDEYQDTNLIQSELVDLLAARHENIMAVGDDSQSIYSWRGANFLNILDFPKRHPKAAIYKIEQNYRSTPEILNVANDAIAANTRQFAKQLAPVRSGGIKPVLAVCSDAHEQAAFVAQRALELREEGFSLGNMAVLYRSHFHAMELQLELTRRNIPFSITSGIRFFEQAHIKDVSSWLRLLANPRDELAFKRIVLTMPGVGPKAADKLWLAFQNTAGAASQEEPSPPKKGTLPPIPAQHPIAHRLSACAHQAPKKAQDAWRAMVLTMDQLEEPSLRESPGKLIQLVLDAGYEDYLRTTYDNSESRLEDAQQLANFAAQYRQLDEFLSELSLLSTVDAEQESTQEKDEERIRLSSIHQAKGLEFDIVFIIMLCDGLFPTFRALDDPEREEEERRLFYVAVTRARNELYLSYPIMRFAQGYENAMQQPSRFLAEIKPDKLDQWTLRSGY